MINRKGKSLMETTGWEKWKEHNHLCVLIKGFPRLCRTKWNQGSYLEKCSRLVFTNRSERKELTLKLTLEWTVLTFVNHTDELGLWYALPPVSMNASKLDMESLQFKWPITWTTLPITSDLRSYRHLTWYNTAMQRQHMEASKDATGCSFDSSWPFKAFKLRHVISIHLQQKPDPKPTQPAVAARKNGLWNHQLLKISHSNSAHLTWQKLRRNSVCTNKCGSVLLALPMVGQECHHLSCNAFQHFKFNSFLNFTF